MKRISWIIVVITACFCFFVLGFFLGRKTVVGLTTDKPIPAQPVAPRETKTETSSDPDAINLNTASVYDLQSLPGIGKKTAEKIVAYRDAAGGFAAKEQLMEIEGIGKQTYQKLEHLITVGR